MNQLKNISLKRLGFRSQFAILSRLALGVSLNLALMITLNLKEATASVSTNSLYLPPLDSGIAAEIVTPETTGFRSLAENPAVLLQANSYFNEPTYNDSLAPLFFDEQEQDDES